MREHRRLEKILYIEDEADIRTIAELALEALGGFQLRVCASGGEALAAAEDFAPDLILLDVMMPDLDGPATLLQLRSLPGTRQTPAIFMTAKILPEELAGYRDLGALGVIAKPFDPMTLAEQVRSLWQESVS